VVPTPNHAIDEMRYLVHKECVWRGWRRHGCALGDTVTDMGASALAAEVLITYQATNSLAITTSKASGTPDRAVVLSHRSTFRSTHHDTGRQHLGRHHPHQEGPTRSWCRPTCTTRAGRHHFRIALTLWPSRPSTSFPPAGPEVELG